MKIQKFHLINIYWRINFIIFLSIILISCSKNSQNKNELSGKHAQVIIEYSADFFVDDSLFNTLTADKTIEEFTFEFITNEARINEALKQLNYPRDKKAVAKIRKKIQVNHISNTNKVEINFYDDDENYSLIILNELMKVFLNDLAEYHIAKFVEYDDEVGMKFRRIIDEIDKSGLIMSPTVIKYFMMAADNDFKKKIIAKSENIYKPLFDAFEIQNESQIDSLAKLLDKKEDSILYLWTQKYLHPLNYNLILPDDRFSIKEEQKMEYKNIIRNYLGSLSHLSKIFNAGKAEFSIAMNGNKEFFKMQNILFLERQYLFYEEKRTILRVIRISEGPVSTIIEGPYFYEK